MTSFGVFITPIVPDFKYARNLWKDELANRF